MIYLIGAGLMAIEYAKILNEMRVDFIVVGRGALSAKRFEDKINKKVSLDFKTLDNLGPKDLVINSVGHTELYSVTKQLLNLGAKKILVEKPGAVKFSEIIELNNLSLKLNSEIYIAYNRRFLSSMQKALELIEEDDGLSAIHFEFSELMDRNRQIQKPEEVYRTWFLANSSHVVDMAFYAAGNPKKFSCYRNGEIKLGNQILPASYIGSGITKKDIPFTYSAYWDAPGRWRLELLSKNYRCILSPLETLKLMKRNTFTEIDIELSQQISDEFKPGLYTQVKMFIEGQVGVMNIKEHVDRIDFYSQLSGINDPIDLMG